MDSISSVERTDRRVVLAGLLGCTALMVMFRSRQRHRVADARLSALRVGSLTPVMGKYFEVHDRLMQFSGEYTAAVATDIAGWLNVDPEGFRKDMADPRVDAELQKNFHDARALGVEGTPSIVTARNIEAGGRNLQQLQELIDAVKG